MMLTVASVLVEGLSSYSITYFRLPDHCISVIG